jgi:hypothetical protein
MNACKQHTKNKSTIATTNPVIAIMAFKVLIVFIRQISNGAFSITLATFTKPLFSIPSGSVTQVNQNGIVYASKTDRKCCKNRAFTVINRVNTIGFRSVIDRIIWRRNADRIWPLFVYLRIKHCELFYNVLSPCTIVNKTYWSRISFGPIPTKGGPKWTKYPSR